MKEKELPPEIANVLRECHFAYFCSTDQDNQPHITPVFFLFNKETNEIFVFVYSGSKKMRNIKANPRVCVTVDVRDSENPFENHGVMAQGEATIEKTKDPISSSQDEELRRIDKEFSKKYPLLSEAPTHIKYREFADVLVKVQIDKMVYWKGPHFITVKFNQRMD
jgi:nitroimidazol reductase NimA-like FMN-containing flavoprotein (pyridoxamine 5'-phosphate oxidase superfamily)